jgi:transcriptional regulator with XRE-family HTH domain
MAYVHVDPAARDEIERFGRHLRAARHRRGITQSSLERVSGVDQTVISRLERGLAPKFTLDRLVAVIGGLAGTFPFGECPHDHRCAWSPARRTASEAGESDLGARIEAVRRRLEQGR